MKKYLCDRCGHEVKDNYPFVLIYGLICEGIHDTRTMDLCGTCYNELVDFIEGDKEDKQD